MGREYGIIERGEILTVEQSGYTIASYSRDGITTPPLKALMDGKTYSVGDKVSYFIFSDGTGRVIDKI